MVERDCSPVRIRSFNASLCYLNDRQRTFAAGRGSVDFGIFGYQTAFSHSIEDAAPSLHRVTLFGEGLILWRTVHLVHVILSVEVELSQEEVL